MIGPLWTPSVDMAVVGHPVNCCTKALKFVVLALRRVVGVLLEALDLLLIGLHTLPFGVNWLEMLLLLLLLSDDGMVGGGLVLITSVFGAKE